MESVGLAEPVHSKRKFPSFKPAKQLPRRVSGEDWCVYAAIVKSEGGDSEYCGSEVGGQATDGGEAFAVHGGNSERGSDLHGKGGRSVRFAGIERGSSKGGEHPSSSEEHEGTGDSSYTLSKFKFPAPPSYAWVGTFGKYISLLCCIRSDVLRRSLIAVDATCKPSDVALQRSFL